MGTNIRSMLVRNSKFTSFIDEFTENTYIMVVISDPKIRKKIKSDLRKINSRDYEYYNAKNINNVSFVN